MDTTTGKTAEGAGGALFIAFAFSIAGWALLETWLLRIGGGLRAQGIAALFGLGLGFLSIRRPRIGAAGRTAAATASAHAGHGLGRKDAGWALLLFGLGVVLGRLLLWGETVVLGAAAVGMILLPWSKVRFCRTHFLAGCIALWSGLLAMTALRYSSINPMFLPIACWVLWASAGVALCMRIERMTRADKARANIPRQETAADTSA